jgi:hypothetical protein
MSIEKYLFFSIISHATSSSEATANVLMDTAAPWLALASAMRSIMTLDKRGE